MGWPFGGLAVWRFGVLGWVFWGGWGLGGFGVLVGVLARTRENTRIVRNARHHAPARQAAWEGRLGRNLAAPAWPRGPAASRTAAAASWFRLRPPRRRCRPAGGGAPSRGGCRARPPSPAATARRGRSHSPAAGARGWSRAAERSCPAKTRPAPRQRTLRRRRCPPPFRAGAPREAGIACIYYSSCCGGARPTADWAWAHTRHRAWAFENRSGSWLELNTDCICLLPWVVRVRPGCGWGAAATSARPDVAPALGINIEAAWPRPSGSGLGTVSGAQVTRGQTVCCGPNPSHLEEVCFGRKCHSLWTRTWMTCFPTSSKSCTHAHPCLGQPASVRWGGSCLL